MTLPVLRVAIEKPPRNSPPPPNQDPTNGSRGGLGVPPTMAPRPPEVPSQVRQLRIHSKGLKAVGSRSPNMLVGEHLRPIVIGNRYPKLYSVLHSVGGPVECVLRNIIGIESFTCNSKIHQSIQ